jgi:protease I
MIKKYLQFIKESKKTTKVAILTDNEFQDEEVLQPKSELEKNNYLVDIIAPKLGTIKAFNNDEEVNVTKTISEASVKDYALLIIPGGKAPENLRNNESVINFVKKFYETKKPIASICHGPLILISAELVKGKPMTCFEDAVEELKEAGANYKNESCVQDGQFITSRNPNDLDEFCKAILAKLK